MLSNEIKTTRVKRKWKSLRHSCGVYFMSRTRISARWKRRVPGLGQKWDVIARDAYLHEPRRSFVLISQEFIRFLNSVEIAAKWAMLSASCYRTSNMKIFWRHESTRTLLTICILFFFFCNIWMLSNNSC